MQKFFVIPRNYCQGLGLDNILLPFYVMMSQNICPFTVGRYFIVNFYLTKPVLKLV